jgi:LemA protein
MIEWIVLVIVAIFAVLIIFLYNNLIRLRNQVKNSWAQIDVQLKRRNDLIPNLVETVKGYLRHERGVLTDVTNARANLLNASALSDKAKASTVISDSLKSIFAVAENYPKLRASENFIQLQQEISGTENRISFTRQFYNDSVTQFNNKIQVFPNSLFARIFGFREAELFEALQDERKDVQIK